MAQDYSTHQGRPLLWYGMRGSSMAQQADGLCRVLAVQQAVKTHNHG